MFTGIVGEVGTVISLQHGEHGARLRIACTASLEDAIIGASIAVNGACLTATELNGAGFSADLSPETLRRTNLADLRTGDPVNLERPLRVTGRLDGHFVLGHVDGTGTITNLQSTGDESWWLQVRLPHALNRYVVSKGSLAVDGISLTVAEVEGSQASFAIIPHTYAHTSLRARKPGERVNLEADILAKHVDKLVSSGLVGAQT
jgi:riboflavin synthase